MAFWNLPPIEPRSECINCGADMEYSSEVICSATCADLQSRGLRRQNTDMDDWENLGEFVAEQHEPIGA